MVEEKITLTRGGVYLVKLDPAKTAEIGKIRPVVVLSAQTILDITPPTIFICPLSSQSYPEFSSLHVKLTPRDNLEVTSFALTEHCRSVSMKRVVFPRLAQLTQREVLMILDKLQRMVGL